MSEAVRQLKQAKQELDTRQYKAAMQTVTALTASLSSSHPGSNDKERKRLLDLRYQALLLLGLVHQHCQRYAAAEAEYRQAAAIAPELPAAHRALHELYVLTRDTDRLLALMPTLLPIQRAAGGVKYSHYALQLAEALLQRRRTEDARRLLFSLAGLQEEQDSSEEAEEEKEEGDSLPALRVLPSPPVLAPSLFLPPVFFRLFFGLCLQLLAAEQEKVLAVSVDRQLKRLRVKREEKEAMREKEERRRQQLQRQREGKVTVQLVGKEEKEREAKAERDEEAAVKQRVQARLHSDWLRRDDVDERLEALHEWAEGYGMSCDDGCAHREEQDWLQRGIERMQAATTAEEYAKTRATTLARLDSMQRQHPASLWCREQAAGMEADLWLDDGERSRRRKALVRSVRQFPASSPLRHALCLQLCGIEEDGRQARQDAIVWAYMQQHSPSSLFPPSLSSAHFYSRYLALYAQAHPLASAVSPPASLSSIISSARSLASDLAAYQSSHSFHPLTSCVVAIDLLTADLLTSARDDRSAEEAVQLYSRHCEDGRQRVRQYAVWGLVKAAVLRRQLDIAAVMQAIQRWRQEGGADSSSAAWLSCFAHLTRLQEDRRLRQETVRLQSRQQQEELRQRDAQLLHGLLQLLSNAALSFPVLLLKAKVMWELSGEYRTERRFCYSAFISALQQHLADSASLSPSSLSSSLLSHADCFAYLGLFTQRVLQSPLKAQLFFSKALDIQPHNGVAGPALAAIYLSSSPAQHSALLSLCDSAIRVDPRCRWAYLTAARHHAAEGRTQQAIALYQHALRSGGGEGGGSGGSALVWCELGDRYFEAGSVVAALRCWQRSVELNAESDAARYGCAQVLLMMERHDEAVAALQQMIAAHRDQLQLLDQPSAEQQQQAGEQQQEGDYAPRHFPLVAVTRLLAEAQYSHAALHCGNGAYTAALCCLSACIDTAVSCLALVVSSLFPSHTGGLHKLLGDAHALYSVLPVTETQELSGKSRGSSKCEKLQLAIRYYSKALLRWPTLAALWYDCGLANRHLLFLFSASSSPGGAAAVNALRHRCLACFQQSVLLAPSNPYHWLGLASVLQSFTARHSCIVQSLQAQRTPTAWAHLSLLYLQHGGGRRSIVLLSASSSLPPAVELSSVGDGSAYSHLDAARRSLQLAQTAEPMLPAAWLAQALFNSGFMSDSEVVGGAAVCFHRSLELGGATETARAGLVWSSLMTADMLTAAYHSRKLVEQWPACAAGWNMHGLCCQWRGSHDEAERAFAMAESLMQTQTLLLRADDDADWTAKERRARQLLLRCIALNRARSLEQLGRYSDSLELTGLLLQGDAALAVPAVSFASLALRHHLVQLHTRAGQYEQGKQEVVAAMGIITEARSALEEEEEEEEEDGEEERSEEREGPAKAAIEDGLRVEDLVQEYHQFFLQFLHLLLLWEGKEQEALHHLRAKLESDDADAESSSSADEERRLELLQVMLSIGIRCRGDAVLRYSTEMSTQSTVSSLAHTQPSCCRSRRLSVASRPLCCLSDCQSRLLALTPATHHPRLLAAACDSRFRAAMALGNVAAARRAYLQLVHSQPTSMSAWSRLLASQLQSAPSLAYSLLPLITVPSLHDLRFQHQTDVIERLRLLAHVYLLLNRFTPLMLSLSAAFEQEQADNARKEEAQLLAEHSAEERKDGEEDESEDAADAASSRGDALQAEDDDDDLKHGQQLLEAGVVSSLVEVTASAFDFPTSAPPPSSQQAVSAAARLVLLQPTTSEHWALLAAAAEGRETDRRREEADSDAGWSSVLYCHQQHLAMLEQLSLSALPPPQRLTAQAETAALQTACSLSMVCAMCYITADSEMQRAERLRGMKATMTGFSQAALTSPYLQWLYHRAQARVSLCEKQPQRALNEYERCIAIATAAAAATAMPFSSSSPPLPLACALPASAAVIWEEVAELMGDDDGRTQALQSGLQLCEEAGGAQQGQERLRLLLSLLQHLARTEQYQAAVRVVRAEAGFLLSQPSSSALRVSSLLCDLLERSGSGSRDEYTTEVRALAAQRQEWQKACSRSPQLRWQQPLPASTVHHLAPIHAQA